MQLAFVSALPGLLGAFRAVLPDPRASEQRFSVAWTPCDGLNATSHAATALEKVVQKDLKTTLGHQAGLPFSCVLAFRTVLLDPRTSELSFSVA